MSKSSDDMVTLYHFTNREAWTDIVLDGEIRPSDKSLDRDGDAFWLAHNAPDIVWLTTDPTPGWCCERRLYGNEPYAVRFTVRLPATEVHNLWEWATRHKVYPEQSELDVPVIGEGRLFRCIERPIVAHAEWVAIHEMHRDKICPAPWGSDESRAWLAHGARSLPEMSPGEFTDAIALVAALTHAFREEVRGV